MKRKLGGLLGRFQGPARASREVYAPPRDVRVETIQITPSLAPASPIPIPFQSIGQAEPRSTAPCRPTRRATLSGESRHRGVGFRRLGRAGRAHATLRRAWHDTPPARKHEQARVLPTLEKTELKPRRVPELTSQRASGSFRRPSSCAHAAWAPRACAKTWRRPPRRSGNPPVSRQP